MLGVISLETPQWKWVSSRLEGRTSWIFSSWGRCSRLTTGTSGTRSGGLRKGQSPCELLGGLSGFLSRRCSGLRPCVESVPEPEDSSPVLTWILGYFWILPRGVSRCLEKGHARALSSQAAAAVSGFPSRGSRDLWLSHEAFPQGFPTRLSHKSFPRVQGRETIPRVARCLSPFQGTCFPALPPLSSRGSTHTTVARGTALWEILVGKPRGKATDPLIHAKGSVTLLLKLERKAHVQAPTRDED